MNTQNNFQKTEEIGRTLFRDFANQAKNVTDLKFEEDQYSPTDCTYKVNDKLVIGEIKVRDEYCKNFDDLILEKKKYDSIKDKMNELNAKAGVYINYIGDNILYMFNIDNINDNTCKRMNKGCKRTTAEYSGYTNKDVYLVPKSLGIKFEYNGEKWLKS